MLRALQGALFTAGVLLLRTSASAQGSSEADASGRPPALRLRRCSGFRDRAGPHGRLAPGVKAIWDRIMDPSCVVTTEEGQVMTKGQFLEELRPLPQGLSGSLVIKELTVQEFPAFALVRYRADESESVFGQRLAVQYRVTNAYRRDAPAWKMVASHLSVVTRDPPAQDVSKAGWPGLVGQYRLLPDGWTLTVELRDGELYAGRDPKKLRRLIPLTPDAFVVSGSLGEWVFVVENGKGARIVNLRKFAVLVWSRVEATR
jgi:ketosteroid isomerase-like protein